MCVLRTEVHWRLMVVLYTFAIMMSIQPQLYMCYIMIIEELVFVNSKTNRGIGTDCSLPEIA